MTNSMKEIIRVLQLTTPSEEEGALASSTGAASASLPGGILPGTFAAKVYEAETLLAQAGMMCVCVCVCCCGYVYFQHFGAHIHMYMHTYICTCIHTRTHTYIHTCLHAYTHAYLHIYIVLFYVLNFAATSVTGIGVHVQCKSDVPRLLGVYNVSHNLKPSSTGASCTRYTPLASLLIVISCMHALWLIVTVYGKRGHFT